MDKKILMGWCFFALALVVLVLSSRVHAMSCGEAVVTLLPCRGFLIEGEDKPTAPCCSGVQTVEEKATTKEDRKSLCECLKKSIPSLGVNPEKARQLPDLCGVKVPVPIDPDMDCNKVE